MSGALCIFFTYRLDGTRGGGGDRGWPDEMSSRQNLKF